jgi:uncharacterized protein
MIFEIEALKKATGEAKKFYYDNEFNILKDEKGFIWEYPNLPEDPHAGSTETVPFSKDDPLKKSNKIHTLKIQLGLSCNYSCDYCSQKFVERPPETSKKDIDDFIKKLDVLEFSEERGLKIEFWGGEPLVYWKTLKPLAEALQEKFDHWEKKPTFGIVTNGSLLTREICSWLYYMGFGVGISHDGPGQSVRGPDPFDDPEKKEIILEFYKVMKQQHRISFNSMLNNKNISRKAVYEWFAELTGDPDVSIGEGSIVDAYDEDGVASSLDSLEEHFAFRRNAFNDIYSTDGSINFNLTLQKVDDFTKSVLSHRRSKYVGQKCGMDDQNTIAVDLKGNIVTCQNVSVMETSKNGESHLGGNLEDYSNVELKSVTHWKNRNNCSSCPVLHLCKGSCMYLDGKYWDVTCDNAYSDNIALFSLSIEKITNGFIPVIIRGEGLPLERQDIWGTQFQHQEKAKKKIIPIKVVSEKIGKIDEVEIYGKSRVEV